MADYNFRVRATDANGAFADRDFSITVRNTQVDRVVMVDSSAGNAYSSTSGVTSTWTNRTGKGGVFVKHGGGQWIVFTNGNVIYTSPDAINWTTRTISGVATSGTVTTVVHAVAYNDGMWMMIARNSANTTTSSFTSTDGGLTWTEGGAITASATVIYRSLAYGNGTWLVGNTSSNTTIGVKSTNNGSSWTGISYSSNIVAEGVIYVGGRWVVTDSVLASPRVIISNDNMTNWYPYSMGSNSFTQTTGVVSTYRPTQLVYANGRLFANTVSSTPQAGTGTNITWKYFYSDDGGLTWALNPTSPAAFTTGTGYMSISMSSRMAYYNGSLIVACNSSAFFTGRMFYSTNLGASWSTDSTSFTNPNDVAVLSI